jgi:hypothetical protein
MFGGFRIPKKNGGTANFEDDERKFGAFGAL